MPPEKIAHFKGFSNPPASAESICRVCCIINNIKYTEYTVSVKKLISLKPADFKKDMQKRIGRMEKDFRSELSSQRYNQAKKEMRLDTDRNDSNIFYKFSDPSTIPDDSKKDISYPLARYCIVMIELYELMEELEPLMNEDKIASENLRVAKDNFAKISAELSKMEADLSKLQKDYDENMAEEKRLLDSIEDSRIKLDRAEKLNHLLKDEAIRWKESLEESKLATKTFLGNVILSSGVINYFGPLNGAFRHKLYDSWHSIVTKNGIMITERDKFSLEKIIGDTLVIRDWYNCGLPTDQVSTENGLIALNGYKWPMMIDPQMQANRWLKRYLNIKDEDEIKEVEIKKQVKEYNSSDSEYSEDYDSDPAKAMHEDLYVDGLKVINPSMDDNIFMNTMKVALERGFPVLIEDFGTTINPAIEAIVVKQFKVKSLNDSKSVKFMDEEELPVHENFRLFFTTKTANPAFLPDIFIKTNVINFTVTIKGLEDQLLGDVVKIVNPEIEQMKIENVENLSKCKKTLAKQERKILALLVSEDSSPVESPKLVESLEESERISKDIAEKVASSEKSNITIDKKREEFREVARQGSLIYFAVDDVSKITPMYQYSLQYIKKIFVTAIEGANLTQMMSPVEIRDELISLITKSIYQNVSRGLFEEHKLIFSFILCISFNMNSNKVSQDDWNLFLRGAPLASIDPTKKNPNEEFITKTGWDLACYLDAHLEKWHGICADLENNLADLYNFTETIDVFRDPLPKLCRITGANLTDFEKLLLIKIVRSDKLYYCISGYIKHNIGRDGNYFVGSLPIDMDQIYLESDPQTPIIFVLSQGADPKSLMNGLFTKIRDKTRVVVEEEPEPAEGEKPIEEHHQNHEDEHNHDKDNSHIKPFELEWNSISLGQGQGERAEKGIQLSSEKGGWMLLENCHLAKSWMPQLDKIVQKLQSDDSKDKLHKDFRLFLTSMPVAYFPIPILQNGIKITTEPPRGIKANMIRSLNAIEEETFLDGVALREPMHKLTMGLCFFHAIIQERRKFGPLGWNKIYEFNDSDLDTSKKNLFNFLYPLNEDQLEDIPWESLVYITGVINYGGRVTDNLDKRLLMSIMEQFYTVKILDKKLNSFDGYCWTDNTLYHIPAVQTLDHYKEYINNLGDSDDPDVFGLHENANIAYQSQETDKILSIVGNIQPNDGKK